MNNPVQLTDPSGRVLTLGDDGGACVDPLCATPVPYNETTTDMAARFGIPLGTTTASATPSPVPGPAPSVTPTDAPSTSSGSQTGCWACAIAFGPDATYDNIGGGVMVISNASGIYGNFATLVGAQAITFGGGTIVAPGPISRCGPTLAHELGHVVQQRAFPGGDAGFVLAYLLLMPFNTHDSHPAELNANQYAGLNPDMSQPNDWRYTAPIGCP